MPERLGARGEILVPLDEDAVRDAARQLAAEGVESVAVVFLFSYRAPAHEQRAAEIVARELPGASVSASHWITQEWREYERTSTTVVNAYIRPVMDRYLGAFGRALGGRGFRGQVLVTQSNGGAFSLEAARSKPVHTMESGPAAGATGCASLARILGADRLIAFDMCGTTAKWAISTAASSRPRTSTTVDGHPVPSRDRHQRVSAGGGTIAWIDTGGDRPSVAERGGRSRPVSSRAAAPRGPRDVAARPHRRRPLLEATMPLEERPAQRHRQHLACSRTRARRAPRRIPAADVKMALPSQHQTSGHRPGDYAWCVWRRRAAYAVAMAASWHSARRRFHRPPSTFPGGGCSHRICATTWCARCSKPLGDRRAWPGRYLGCTRDRGDPAPVGASQHGPRSAGTRPRAHRRSPRIARLARARGRFDEAHRRRTYAGPRSGSS